MFSISPYCSKVGKVFIPGLLAPSLTMCSAMPRPSTPLDTVSTPKPLSQLLGSLDEVRNQLCDMNSTSAVKKLGRCFFYFNNDGIGSLANNYRMSMF